MSYCVANCLYLVYIVYSTLYLTVCKNCIWVKGNGHPVRRCPKGVESETCKCMCMSSFESQHNLYSGSCSPMPAVLVYYRAEEVVSTCDHNWECVYFAIAYVAHRMDKTVTLPRGYSLSTVKNSTSVTDRGTKQWYRRRLLLHLMNLEDLVMNCVKLCSFAFVFAWQYVVHAYVYIPSSMWVVVPMELPRLWKLVAMQFDQQLHGSATPPLECICVKMCALIMS